MNQNAAQSPDRPSWRKLGLIAGAGDLPLRVAAAERSAGRELFIAGLAGFANAEGIAPYPHDWVGLGELGKLLNLFKDEGCDAVSFAGVVKRPDFSSLKVDWRGATLLPKVLKAARRGDDALLRVIVDFMEDEGFAVIAPNVAAGGLAVPVGPVGSLTPSAAMREDIRKAFRVAQIIGQEDIGQGAVVCDGLVLALEAQEGTDLMLARVAELPEEVRGTAEARRGVLAKIAKPAQERRIDLPTLGVRTVEGVARAGLAGLAVEERGALLVDRDAVAAAADEAGVFVVAIPSADIPPVDVT